MIFLLWKVSSSCNNWKWSFVPPPAFIFFSFSLIIIGFNHIFFLMLGKICAGGYLSMGRWWWQVIYNLFFSVMYSFISKRKLSFYLSQTHLGYLCISQFLPAPRPHNDEILAQELVLDWISPISVLSLFVPDHYIKHKSNSKSFIQSPSIIFIWNHITSANIEVLL
jgi:hypothetical protein